MRTNTTTLILAVCLACSLAVAVSPPVPPPLDKRIGESTLVIVGTVTKVGTVTVSDARWAKWESMEPRADKVSSNIVGALTIRIEETLYAKHAVNSNTVVCLFGDWGFKTADLDHYIGTKQIFILSSHDGAFVSAYARWRLCEPMERHEEVLKAITDMRQKTTGSPNQAPEDTARKLADPQR